MSASTAPLRPDPARASQLVAELEKLLPDLFSEALLDLQPAVARIEGAIVCRALQAAFEKRREASRDLTLKEAAAPLGMSEQWLRGHRRELRVGYRLGGEWRFSESELLRLRCGGGGQR